MGLNQALNPHNEFFSTFLDLGLTGFCLLILILLVPLKKAISKRDILQISFLLILFLHFLIESILLRQKGILFFVFFYSLLFWQSENSKLKVKSSD